MIRMLVPLVDRGVRMMVSALADHLPQRFVSIILAGAFAVSNAISLLKFEFTNRAYQFLFDHCFCLRKAFGQAGKRCTTSRTYRMFLIKQALQ